MTQSGKEVTYSFEAKDGGHLLLGLSSILALGNPKLAKFWLEKYCASSKAEQPVLDLLHAAARNGNYKAVRYLVGTYKINIGTLDALGWNALHYALASESQPLNIVKYLARKISVNAKTQSEGFTPLHVAISHDFSEAVKYLVEDAKVDLTIKDNKGNTPLQHASNNKIVEYEVYLKGEEIKRETGENRNFFKKQSRSPLFKYYFIKEFKEEILETKYRLKLHKGRGD